MMLAGLVFAEEDEPVLRAPSLESQLLHTVEPEYPSAALQRRIQVTVRFNAIVGKDGRVEALRLVSGHPLLVRAAREAARQWIYRPSLLDGKPVRVITQIDVVFQLGFHEKPGNVSSVPGSFRGFFSRRNLEIAQYYPV